MNIKALVDRGLELREQIERMQKELKEIEGQLKEVGLKSEQEDLKDADREGKRWLAQGTRHVVPVIFTADKIVGQFQANGATHSQVKVLAGEDLRSFFKLQQVYNNQFESGKKFRQMAESVLGSKAPAFITACLTRDKFGVPKSDIKVEWGEAGPAINTEAPDR